MRINDVLGNNDVLPVARVIFLSQIMDFGVHFHCLLKNIPQKSACGGLWALIQKLNSPAQISVGGRREGTRTRQSIVRGLRESCHANLRLPCRFVTSLLKGGLRTYITGFAQTRKITLLFSIFGLITDV